MLLRTVRLTCVLAAALAAACDPGNGAAPRDDARYAREFRVVQIDASASVTTQLAVHACAGLFNRRLGGSVFVQTDPAAPQSRLDGAALRDEVWLDLLNLKPGGQISATSFLKECVADFGCARYAYASQHEILPSILTAASAEGLAPLADESPLQCTEPALDATKVFAGKTTQLEATRYVYEEHLAGTTGMAMLSPGYNQHATDLSAPDLNADMPVVLVDLVFSRKLFALFLVKGCIDGHPEKKLLQDIVTASPWPTPIGVYGYNDSWLQGGYLYEAQSRCLDSANMGAIPTRTTNLSFFDSRRAPIVRAADLPAIAPEAIDYDPAKTYVAFVVGDGDNIRYMMSTRKEWMEQRLAACRGASPRCPPLTWSISPHLPDLAPDVLAWYYRAAQSTGADYFILPPSGYQYAYPTSLNDGDQARFAAATERAARILGTRSVVHWEWFQSWREATGIFLPRYAHAGGQIRGIFPINVPYMFEAFTWWPAGQTYEVLTGAGGGKLAVFRPQSWRGVDDSDDYHVSPQHMADRLGALPKGTVTWVYMTSDGGLSLKNSYFELFKVLPAHVQIVSTDAAAELAIRAQE